MESGPFFGVPEVHFRLAQILGETERFLVLRERFHPVISILNVPDVLWSSLQSLVERREEFLAEPSILGHPAAGLLLRKLGGHSRLAYPFKFLAFNRNEEVHVEGEARRLGDEMEAFFRLLSPDMQARIGVERPGQLAAKGAPGGGDALYRIEESPLEWLSAQSKTGTRGDSKGAGVGNQLQSAVGAHSSALCWCSSRGNGITGQLLIDLGFDMSVPPTRRTRHLLGAVRLFEDPAIALKILHRICPAADSRLAGHIFEECRRRRNGSGVLALEDLSEIVRIGEASLVQSERLDRQLFENANCPAEARVTAVELMQIGAGNSRSLSIISRAAEANNLEAKDVLDYLRGAGLRSIIPARIVEDPDEYPGLPWTVAASRYFVQQKDTLIELLITLVHSDDSAVFSRHLLLECKRRFRVQGPLSQAQLSEVVQAARRKSEGVI